MAEPKREEMLAMDCSLGEHTRSFALEAGEDKAAAELWNLDSVPPRAVIVGVVDTWPLEAISHGDRALFGHLFPIGNTGP